MHCRQPTAVRSPVQINISKLIYIILHAADFICNDFKRDRTFETILTLIVSMYALAYFWQSSTLSL